MTLIREVRERLSGPRADLYLIAVAVVLWGLAFWPTYVANGDGASMLEEAKSLADGRIDVPCSAGIHHEGLCYSNFYPLQSFLAAPLVFLIRLLPVGNTDGLISTAVHAIPVAAAAGSAVLVVLIARELGADRRASILAAVAMVLCTEMFVYARSFFTASLAAFVLTLAVYGYMRFERRTVLAALGTFGIVMAKPQLVFVALALVAAASLSYRGRARAMSLAVGAGAIALATLVHGLHNLARFDSASDFGGEQRTLDGSALAPDAVIDALGLLFVSPGRGLLVYSPLAAVGFVALILRTRGTRLAGIAVAVAAAALLVAILNPGGGVNWGTRYLVPVIPIACVGLAVMPRAWRPAALALGVWGLLVNLPTAIVPFESAYRGPVAARQEPSTIYWLFDDGPIVRVWNQFPDVFDNRSAWILWWREVPEAAVPIAVFISLAALLAAGWPVAKALQRRADTRAA